MEDAPVPQVFDLDGVSTLATIGKALTVPSPAVAVTVMICLGCRSSPIGMSKTSLPSRPSELASSSPVNTNGRTPIITRLLRWIRSKLARTARTPCRNAPFAAQSRLGAPAVFGAGEHYQWHALFLYFIAAS